jgi:hypothetical protein
MKRCLNELLTNAKEIRGILDDILKFRYDDETAGRLAWILCMCGECEELGEQIFSYASFSGKITYCVEDYIRDAYIKKYGE